MLVIECLLLIGVFGIGLIASISDMKEGVIHNRVVALFAVLELLYFQVVRLMNSGRDFEYMIFCPVYIP